MSEKERLIKIIKAIIDDLSSQKPDNNGYHLKESGDVLTDLLSGTDYTSGGYLTYSDFVNYIKDNSEIFSLYGIGIDREGGSLGDGWDVVVYNEIDIQSI